MLHITNNQLADILDYPRLVEGLQQAFQEDYNIPLRHHHNFENPEAKIDSTLLLMPAWQKGQYLGVKLVTVSPENSRYHLPSINGIYVLFDAVRGIPLAQMDAKVLTNRRTAAASALASRLLSRKDSQKLLVVGTGALAPHLARAHAAVRPIQEVAIWGRSPEKAAAIAQQLQAEGFSAKAVSNLEEAVPVADIISCATMSTTPVLEGKWLQPGQHIDLVGSFKPNMREADNDVIRRSLVFVDTFEGATKETGDIVLPLRAGVLTEEDIQADLFALCKDHVVGRREKGAITLFKSVGLALEDLAAAKIAYENLSNQQ
jgi:alanine dehydrogenase